MFIYADSLVCWEGTSKAKGIWTYFETIGIRFKKGIVLLLGLLSLSKLVSYSYWPSVSTY